METFKLITYDMFSIWPNALDKVLVGVPVPSQQLPHGRNHMEGVEVVQGLQFRWSNFAEFCGEGGVSITNRFIWLYPNRVQ
jgi:hypothetical protein